MAAVEETSTEASCSPRPNSPAPVWLHAECEWLGARPGSSPRIPGTAGRL